MPDYGSNFFVSDSDGNVYEIHLPEEYVEFYKKNDTTNLFNVWQTELFIMNQYKDKVKEFHEKLISTQQEEYFHTYALFDEGYAPSEGFKNYINMVERYRAQRNRVEAIVEALKECREELHKEEFTDEVL